MKSEITLPVQDLKATILPALGRVVVRRHSLPVLSTIRVTRTTEGVVTLHGTDLDSHAIYNMAENQPGAPLDVLVAFEPFTKLVKGLGNKDTLTLAVEGQDKARARYQVAGTELEKDLPSEPLAEFPALPAVNQKPMALGADFGVALKQAFQCCSNDPTRQVLNGACLDGSDSKGHYVVATNGRILFSANSFSFDWKRPVIMPGTKFLTATDMLEEGCLMAVEPPAKKAELGWIKLSSPRWTYLVRENIGPFPNYRQVIPSMEKPAVVLKLSPASIQQILEILPHLPGDLELDHKVRLKVETGGLRVEGPDYEANKWQGVTVEDVAITGKPMAIALNRNYLATALRFGLSEIRLEDELSAMVFINGGKKMVVMPVRLNATASGQTPAPPAKPSPAPNAASTPAPTATPQPITTPQPNAEAQHKETEMPKTTSTASTTTPPATATTVTTAPESPFKLAMQQVEQLRENVKNVLRDIGAIGDTLKLAEKEKKTSDKEIEQFRDKLREIQGIKI